MDLLIREPPCNGEQANMYTNCGTLYLLLANGSTMTEWCTFMVDAHGRLCIVYNLSEIATDITLTCPISS